MDREREREREREGEIDRWIERKRERHTHIRERDTHTYLDDELCLVVAVQLISAGQSVESQSQVHSRCAKTREHMH